MDLERRLVRNPRIADQTLGGKAVVLHYEGRRLVGLNETGTAVWTRLDGTRTLSAIAREVADAAGIPFEEAAGPVAEFASSLIDRDLVVVAEGPSGPATTEVVRPHGRDAKEPVT